jgi:hypothetical protein
VKYGIGTQSPRLDGVAILAVYGLTYFGVSYLLGVEECARAVKRFIP